MGQRANLIIMENSEYTLYYDHWAANSLDAYLFWGPEKAVTFFKNHEKSGEEYWLDTVWCEGGAVIDLDLKVLLFFGGEDIFYDIHLRNTYLKLLSEMWPGYLIKWAHHGVLDLAEYVGYSKIEELNEPSASPRKVEWKECFDCGDGKELEGALSIVDQGTLLIYPLYGYDAGSKVLNSGEILITVVENYEGQVHFEFPDLSTESYPDFARAGIHMDCTSRTLFYWLADSSEISDEQLQILWPDWTIVNLLDDYKKHERLTQQHLLFLGCEEERLIDRIRTIVCGSYGKGDSLIDELTESLKKEGKEVQVNPLIHATNLFEMSTKMKDQLFTEAVAKVIS